MQCDGECNAFMVVAGGILNFYIFIILAVFISGLMGRTPNFRKKIEAKSKLLLSLPFFTFYCQERQHLILLQMILQWLLVCGNATGWLTTWASWIFGNVYEYTSSAANNGSGFEGLGDNNPLEYHHRIRVVIESFPSYWAFS
jgi:K+-transporting ATPase ATPase A chain